MKHKKIFIGIGILLFMIIVCVVVQVLFAKQYAKGLFINNAVQEKSIETNIAKIFKGFGKNKKDLKQNFEKEKQTIKCDKSEKEYLDLVQKDPHNEINYFCIAEINKNQEHFQEAIENYQIAYNLKPENDNFLKQIIGLNLKLNQYKIALENIDKLLAKESNSAELHLFKCQALAGENLLKDALVNCNKAVELTKDDADIYYQRCKIKSKLNDNDGALKDCDKAVSIQPNNSEIYAELCQIEFKKENFQKSFEYCETAKNKGSKSSEVFYNIGHINFYEKEYKTALENLDKAIDLNPNNGLAYLTRCQSKIHLKEYEDAYADCKMAIDLQPNVLAYSSKAQIEYELQNYTAAINDCNAIISVAKDYPDAYLIRGKAYLITGNKKQAKEDLKMAQKIFLAEDNIEKYEEVSAIIDVEN